MMRVVVILKIYVVIKHVVVGKTEPYVFLDLKLGNPVFSLKNLCESRFNIY